MKRYTAARSLIFTAGALALSTVLAMPALAGYTAGEYEGTGTGRNGDIKVKVTFSDDAIEKVEIEEQSETPTLADKALKQVPEDIVTYQSLGVDVVSGASFTSRGIKSAVADAVTQAGGDADALADVECDYPDLPTDDMDTDVVVIGSGTAGLMAAYTAAKEGKSVIDVEKLDVMGGTLNLSAGLLLTVDSEKNDSSIDDSLDRVIDYYKEINGDSVHQPDFDFTSNLMAQTGATVDELIDMGLDHNDMDLGNYAGTQFTIGYKLAADLQKAAADAGVTFITGTAAKELVTDENGAVTGVVVENRTGSYTISAKKVIVAAGGASWSQDLRDSQEQLANVSLHEKTQVGSTADGMHMLKAIGAAESDDLYVKSSQPDFAEVFHNDWSNTPDTGMTLMIDADGRRFANEGLAPATILNTKMLDHGSSAYWNIIDAENTVGFDEDYFARVKEFAADDKKFVSVYADTLDELAEKLDMDADTLNATVADYNAACEAGEDTEFGKAASYLKAYPEDTGYYAVYRRIGSWGTIGGVIVDEQQHVLDTDGNPIENVFAAGETATGQLFGDYYFGGFSLGLYSTAGRIAAENAVAEIG